MAKDLYIPSIKREVRRKRLQKIRPVHLFLLLLCLTLIGILLFQSIRQGEAERLYQRFLSAWEDQAFPEAKAAYLELLEKKKEAEKKQESRADLFLDKQQRADKLLREKRETLFSQWKIQEHPTLSQEDQAYFLVFQDENKFWLNVYLTTLCNDILSGERNQEQVLPIVETLSQLPYLSRETLAIRELLPKLTAYRNEETESRSEDPVADEIVRTRALVEVASDASLASLRTSFEERLHRLEKEWQEELELKMKEAVRLRRFVSASRLRQRGDDVLGDLPSWKTYVATLDLPDLPPLLPYTGPLYSFRIHPLVRHPDKAMSSPLRKYYMQNVLPQESFENLLQSLYEHDFVLVDPSRQVSERGRVLPLELPEGKRPMILVLEGLHYDTEEKASGRIDRLEVEKDKIYSISTRLSGEELREEDAEATGILERFLEKHPDFSFDGAAGVISLQGRKPIFGYLTNARQYRAENVERAEKEIPLLQYSDEELKEQQEKAREVARQLIKQGWSFASEGYDVHDFEALTSTELEQDLQLWKEDLEGITGPVSTYFFPNASSPGLEDVKWNTLFKAGYRSYLQVGSLETVVSPDRPLLVNSADLNPLALFFKRYSGVLDSDAVYRGILHAKMYDPPKKSKKK